MLVVSSSGRWRWQVLIHAYEHLGFDVVDDEPFRALSGRRGATTVRTADVAAGLDAR